MRFQTNGLALKLTLVVVTTITIREAVAGNLDKQEQPTTTPRQTTNSLRKQKVVDAFRHSWDGYVKYAWGHDDLKPISKGYADSRNQWGATIIDSMSTAIIMGLDDVIQKQLAYVKSVDFTRTKAEDSSVSLFESTIRYIGGLLSAHDLLEGPYARTSGFSTRSDWFKALEILILQAKSLADTLCYAFNTPTGIPYNNLLVNRQMVDEKDKTNGLATTGTLILEWTRLSDILISKLSDSQTNDSYKRYAEITLKAENHLLNPKPRSAEVWPGLVGTRIDIKSGKFIDSNGGWGGSDDSYYEYLLKTALYSRFRFKPFEKKWLEAVDSTIQNLIVHPAGHPEITMVGEFYDEEVSGRMEHLTCFIGGNFMLGGWHLKNNTIFEYGERLTEGCHYAYNTTKTGLAAEAWTIDEQTWVNPREKDFINTSGYRIQSPEFLLRPEVVESYYYGFVFTGDEKYREWAWEAFLAMDKFCKVESGGYMGLVNVNDASDERIGLDHMESFWMGETLKYLYLIFEYGNGHKISVNPEEGWIFTTEAHPLRIVG